MVYTIERFLEESDGIHMWDRDIKAIALEKDVLEKIYFKNAEKILGDTPKPINTKMLFDECEKLKENSNAEDILEYLKKG